MSLTQHAAGRSGQVAGAARMSAVGHELGAAQIDPPSAREGLARHFFSFFSNLRLSQSPGDGHTYCIVLICIVFCYVPKNLSIQFA